MFDMFNKLREAQKLMDESKARLENIYVEADAENGKVIVTANGNKKIKQISINEVLIKEGDKEKIEELVVLAVNKAIEKADKIFESEMKGMTKGIFPNFTGLF